MSQEPVYLTAKGKADLEAELHELIEVRRPEIAATILAAREEGDLRENGAYHDAKDRQGHLEGRIRLLKANLARAQVIEDLPARDVASLGSIVTLTAPGDVEERYTIVGSMEASVAAGRISNESPLGRALLGRKVGDTATVRAPQGEATYTIIRVESSKPTN